MVKLLTNCLLTFRTNTPPPVPLFLKSLYFFLFFFFIFFFFFFFFFFPPPPPPHENFSLIWRRHNYRAAIFYLYSILLTYWAVRFFSASYLWHGDPFIMVIYEDPWHSKLLLSVCQWSWHYLSFAFCLRLVHVDISMFTGVHVTYRFGRNVQTLGERNGN